MRPAALARSLRLTGGTGLAAVALVGAAVAAAATGFFDPVALLVTLGGALGVTAATFPRDRLVAAWAYVVAALEGTPDLAPLVPAVKRLARAHRLDGPLGLERALEQEHDPFLRRAITLSLECEDEADLREALLAEARLRATEGEAARHVVVTLGRLFPAFGLIGTLVGLGLLLRNLAGADLASIGPGLAIAVLTTLYGAVLSNVVVLPIATKLHAHLVHDALRTQLLIDGTLLIQKREYPTRIERALRGYVGEAARERSVLTLTDRAA